MHILQLVSSGLIRDRKNRVKVTWRPWKCFLPLNSLLAKPWVGSPAPRLLSFVFIGYQGHPLHCFSLPPSNIFMADIWECQKYFHVRNISMSGIFSCQEYFYGGSMSLSGTTFLGHSYPSSALQCFASEEWGHHCIIKRLFSVAQILSYIEKWDLGMTTGDGTRCLRMKNLKLSDTDLWFERVRSGWRGKNTLRLQPYCLFGFCLDCYTETKNSLDRSKLRPSQTPTNHPLKFFDKSILLYQK